jgi:hypothetical protein
VSRLRFGRLVARDAWSLWESGGEGAAPAAAALDALPPPVRRYAARALPREARPVRRVLLHHVGSFRTELGGAWLPVRGVEYFTTSPPGFVWWGRVRMAPALWFDARDRSVGGEGSMYVKLASTFRVFDAEGPGIDQGALVRLLGEMVWLPSALFDARWVSWSAVDDRSARATIRVEGHEASCTFHFGPDGLPRAVDTERFRDTEGGPVLTPWSVENEDFREVYGYLVPHRSVVSWHVDGEPSPYADFRVVSIEYDPPERG